MSRVTLQTIADRVGVSRMTVSNAFSRPDQLSARDAPHDPGRRRGARLRRPRPVRPGAGPRHHRRGRRAAHRVDRHRVPRPHRGRVLRRRRRGARPHGHGGRAPAVDQLRGDDPRARHPDGRRAGLRLRRRLPGGRLAGEAPAARWCSSTASPSPDASSVLLDERHGATARRPAPPGPRAPPDRHPHHEPARAARLVAPDPPPPARLRRPRAPEPAGWRPWPTPG